MKTTTTIRHPETWRDLSVKEKARLGSAIALEAAAVVLIFVAFAITLHVGWDVISAAALFLATACTLFGLGIFVKTSLIEIDSKVERRLNAIEQDSINRSM